MNTLLESICDQACDDLAAQFKDAEKEILAAIHLTQKEAQLQEQNPKFNIGFTMGLAAFTAAVIGGIGNIRGAFFGGVALGLAEVYVSSILGTQWKSVTVFIILVLILLFKPSGLFGEAITQARA